LKYSVYIDYEFNYNDRKSCVSDYFCCPIETIVVKCEEINLKFRKFEKVQDIIKFEKVRGPHSITTVIGRHL